MSRIMRSLVAGEPLGHRQSRIEYDPVDGSGFFIL